MEESEEEMEKVREERTYRFGWLPDYPDFRDYRVRGGEVKKILSIVSVFLLLSSFLLATGFVSAANPPEPTYGHATVDGVLSIGEWDTTNDFFANMYRAGDPGKELEAKAYLKYDCNKHVMYVLVLTVPPAVGLSTGWEAAAWSAIGTTSNKVYTGSVGNDGVPPDFAWVGLAYDGNPGHALGYEASFSIDPGTYAIIVHIEVFDSSASQTAATVGFPKTGVLLVLNCNDRHPDIKVDKLISLDGTNWIDASTAPGPTVENGSNVYFMLFVKNTGDVDLSDVVLADAVLNVNIDIGTLTSGHNYTTTIGPVEAVALGPHQNTATVTASFTGQTYTDSHTANYFVEQTAIPAIRVTKYVSVDGGLTWDDANTAPGPTIPGGDPVYYRFVIENNGTVPLTDITLTDSPVLDFSDAIPTIPTPLNLNSGESFEFILGPFAAGIDQRSDTATATGHNDSTTVTDTDDANYFGAHPQIDVNKYVSVDDGVTWINAHELPGPYVLTGQTIQIKINVTNLGNVPITNINLKDTPDMNLGVYNTTLDPGESFEIILTDIVVLEGQDTDVITLTGKYGNTPLSDTDDAHYFGASPAIEVVKYVSVDNQASWLDANDPNVGPYILTGGNVYYKFVVTNIGNVPLTGITLGDVPLMTFIGEIPASLAPGESFTVYAGPTGAEEGQQTDTATATGNYGDAQYEDTDDANYFGASPAIEVLKYVSSDNVNWFDANTAPGIYILTGGTVYYKFVVKNIGNVPLDHVTFTDIPNGNYGTYPILNPGEEFEIIWGPITAIQGQQTDTVTAHGHYDKLEYVDSDDGNYFGASPSIQVIKYISVDGGLTWQDANTVTGPIVTKGKPISFKYVVTNTGNVPLTNVVLTDDVYALSFPPKSLNPGQSFEYPVYGPVTADFGQHTDTATTSGYYSELGYTATDTDTANYYGTLVTYTQGGYAGTGVPGQLLNANYYTSFPAGLEVGYYTASPGYGFLWQSTTLGLTNLKKFLITTASPGAITKDVLNPTSAKTNGGGTLATQTATLTINIAFSGRTGTNMPAGFGDLYYINPGDSLSHKTVNQILDAANKALAGQGLPAGYNFGQVTSLINNLNTAFDNGVPTSWAISYLKETP